MNLIRLVLKGISRDQPKPSISVLIFRTLNEMELLNKWWGCWHVIDGIFMAIRYPKPRMVSHKITAKYRVIAEIL